MESYKQKGYVIILLDILGNIIAFFQNVLVACHWVDCGGGSCNKTSMLSYSCECDAGYYNLLNVTSFPCYRECKITNLTQS